jgi:methyl-accepting chemotaxis protein
MTMKQIQLILVSVLMLGILIGDAILIDLLITNAQSSATTINMAGRQRMLSQKMTKEALLGLLGEDQWLALQQTRQQFKANLLALMQVNTHSDAKVLQQLKMVEQVWLDFDSKIQLVGPDMSLATLSAVSISSVRLMEECDLVVSLLEQDSQQLLTKLRLVVMIFLLITAVAAFHSYYQLRRYLVSRLQKIEALTIGSIKIPQQGCD